MNLVFLDSAFGTFCVVAVLTNGAGQDALVFRAAVSVDRVTVDAGDRGAIFQNVANVSEDMPVACIHCFVTGLRKIHFEIKKEIVARHEVIGIGQSTRVRLTTS